MKNQTKKEIMDDFIQTLNTPVNKSLTHRFPRYTRNKESVVNAFVWLTGIPEYEFHNEIIRRQQSIILEQS